MQPTPPSPDGALGVVVVNYGSHDLIDQNVSALEFGDIPASVFIVDNFISRDEARLISELCDRRGWSCVSNDSNVGFGAAMNRGAASALAAGCTTLLLLNPDATLSPAALSDLYARSVSEPMALLSPRIVKPDGSRWFDGGTVLVDQGRTSTAPGSDSSAPGGWLSGACLMVSAELWTLAGGFDDEYFLYWEDVDLSWRCVEAGGRLEVVTTVEAVHSVGGTQAATGKSSVYVYYNCRNRMIFAARHLPARQQRRWALSTVRYARLVVLRGGRRALLRKPLPLLGAAIGGSIAGLVKAARLSWRR